ncbi:hypothetical protein LZ31DRAFT_596281 [Colletotrichum somersetense]|nr:hypothetical protein LZ31DRAFT_596281 [Colletotrichum somersetense]
MTRMPSSGVSKSTISCRRKDKKASSVSSSSSAIVTATATATVKPVVSAAAAAAATGHGSGQEGRRRRRRRRHVLDGPEGDEGNGVGEADGAGPTNLTGNGARTACDGRLGALTMHDADDRDIGHVGHVSSS